MYVYYAVANSHGAAKIKWLNKFSMIFRSTTARLRRIEALKDYLTKEDDQIVPEKDDKMDTDENK